MAKKEKMTSEMKQLWLKLLGCYEDILEETIKEMGGTDDGKKDSGRNGNSSKGSIGSRRTLLRKPTAKTRRARSS